MSAGWVVVRGTWKLHSWNFHSAKLVANAAVGGTRWHSRVVSSVFCCGLMILPVRGTEYAASAADVRLFELPAQALEHALEAFARTANREILYDGSLTIHRRSADVSGVYAPDVALEILLAGTGLQAETQDRGFFVLKQVDARSSDPRPYYALIQAALRQALCGTGSDQRIAARLWVGRGGDVVQVRGLTADGEQWRIERALKGIRVGAPPANFAQPVTIVVQPDAMKECSAPVPTMIGAAP